MEQKRDLNYLCVSASSFISMTPGHSCNTWSMAINQKVDPVRDAPSKRPQSQPALSHILQADILPLLLGICCVNQMRTTIGKESHAPINVDTTSAISKYTNHPVVIGVELEAQVECTDSLKKHAFGKNCLMADAVLHNVMFVHMAEIPQPVAIKLYVNDVAI